MAKPIHLSKEELSALFIYDNGVIRWRLPYRNLPAEREAGWLIKTTGYRAIKVDNEVYLTHRIVWKLIHGFDPVWVDHINRDRSDNRIENLRECSPSTNQQNRRVSSTSSSGLIGVCKCGNRWQAHIQVNGKQKNLGEYDTKDGALSAYIEAKKQLHTFTEYRC